MVNGSRIEHTPVRRGFTIVELLVAITVIVILMSMGIVGINQIRRLSMKTRTQSIMALTLNGLNASGTTQSQNVSTVEHPLAASASPRQRFVRSDSGIEVASTGMAIRTSDMAYVSGADQGRVILSDDVFADPIAPQFIGLPRWQMGLTGVSTQWVSQWLRISGPGQTGALVTPDLGTWIDEGFVREQVVDPLSEAWEASADKAFSVALGSVLDELTKLGAIRRPEPSRDPLIVSNRLRHDKAPRSLQSTSEWKPGFVREAGVWVPYRIRGPSVVDAWGREILIASTPNGSILLQSAGADGVFRWNAGSDRVLQTGAIDAAAMGDDTDGSIDNIRLGGME